MLMTIIEAAATIANNLTLSIKNDKTIIKPIIINIYLFFWANKYQNKIVSIILPNKIKGYLRIVIIIAFFFFYFKHGFFKS